MAQPRFNHRTAFFSGNLLLALALLTLPDAQAQMIGATVSGSETPSEVKAATLTPSILQGDVDLFTGTYSASYPLGTVSTPGGLSYALALQYTPSISGGATPTLQDGIPYGQGWSLNIPSITVSNAYVNHLTPANEDAIASIENTESGTARVTYDKDGAERPVPETTDGYGVWFAPVLNIPGVVSGRMVFKRFENDGAFFVLNAFETYVEAKFTGDTWEVRTSNGWVYYFGAQVKAVQMPLNKRWVKYDDLDELCNIAPGSGAAAGIRNKVLNALKPRNHTLQWFCSDITDPLHAPMQMISFKYEPYGVFDMYQEFDQTEYMDKVEFELRPDGNTVISNSNPLNGYPKLITAQELLLKQITATSFDDFAEILELEHEVMPSEVGGQMVYPGGPNTTEHDPMYLKEVVYRAGDFGTGSSDLGYANWKRFLHYADDGFTKPAGQPFSVNSNNPYRSLDDKYFAQSTSISSGALAFNNGFLESPALSTVNIWPGDLWEIRTNLGGGDANFDINVVAGDPTITIPVGVPSDAATFENARKTPLFSTFDRMLKWNTYGNETGVGHPTSNMFVMPHVEGSIAQPRRIYIQVGPANSDTDYNMREEVLVNSLLTIPASSPITPSAYNSYYHAKWHRLPDSFPETGNTNGLMSHDPIRHGFGIGLPWSYLVRAHRWFGNNMYVPGTDDPWDALGMQHWWSDGTTQQMPWANEPTFTNGSTLKNVELIRYGKQPYMLRDVKKYVRQGLQSDAHPTGLTLVSHLHLAYQRTSQQVPKRIAYTGIQDYEQFTRQLYELISVEVIPTYPSTAGVQTGPAITDHAFTRFTYSNASTFSAIEPAPIACGSVALIFPDPRSLLIASGRLLSKVVDPLGQVTTIQYNDPRDLLLADLHIQNAQEAGKLLVDDNNTPLTACDDRVVLVPATGTITPTVKEIWRSDETGEQARKWSYSYAEKRAKHNSLPLEGHNSVYRNTRFAGLSFGFGQVTVLEPILVNGGNTRVVRRTCRQLLATRS